MNNKLEVFWSLFENDRDSARDIATLFCNQMSEFLSELERTYTNNDVLGACEMLHKIKGSISFLGFIAEFDYLDLLEENLRDKNILISMYEFSTVKAKLNALILLFKTDVL